MNTKRTTKDSIFSVLFSDPIYQLELYKELHPNEKVTLDDIHDVTLQSTFTTQLMNDLSFTVKDKILFLVEAQSTWSENILIRILLYYADIMKRRIIDYEENVYSSKKIKPLKPEFYVIYTGNMQVKDELSLSSSYFEDEKSDLEIRVHIISKDTDLTNISNQYISFCNIFDEQRRKYKYKHETIVETLKICKNKGILTDFIISKESEVIDTMALVFDQEYATKMTLRDARQEGKSEAKNEFLEEQYKSIKTLVDTLNQSGNTLDFISSTIHTAFSNIDKNVLNEIISQTIKQQK